jgi:SulP family sulfate permease
MFKDFRAALVTATLSLAYSLSTSALIFSGPLQKYLGLGMASALVTAALAAFVTALASGFRFAVAGPTSTIAAALAVTVALIDPVLLEMPENRVVPTVFAVLATATALTGLSLLALGFGRLGKIVRFLPFPVVAGFMGISGWLLASGAVRLTIGLPLTVSSLGPLMMPDKLMSLGMMICFAVFLFFVRRLFRNPTILPGILISGVIAANLAISGFGLAGKGVLPNDFMIGSGSHFKYVFPLFSDQFGAIDWLIVASILPNILAVVFISVLTCLLTCSGLETDLDVDSDLDHELRVQGVANLVAVAAGGFIGLISVGTTRAAHASGGTGRAVGYITGFICLAALLSGISFIDNVPRFLIGGLQLALGAEVLWMWCIASRERMPLNEWLLVIGIVAVAIWFGFMPAVLCGIAGGCVLFAFKVSRIEVVRRVYGLDERSSTVVRSEPEIKILAEHGARTKVIELYGFIFFGSAYQLLNVVQAILLHKPQRLILDFTNVSGGDSSTTVVLARLTKLLQREGTLLIFAGVPQRILALLHKADVIDGSVTVVPDRETALQFAEVAILDEVFAEGPESITLTTWLTQALGCEAHAHRLLPLLQRTDFKAGDYICRQGDPTDSLIFIERGRIGVMIGADAGEHCVRVFGPHTIAGEQGFVLQTPRSASLKVEQDATIWSLSRQTYDTLVETQSDVVVALMRDIIRLQSERLMFATRQASALSR